MHTQESSIYISTIIICSILAFILGYCAYIIFRLQRKYYRLKEKKQANEIDLLQKERGRIAADLHDELAPLLNITLKLLELPELRKNGARRVQQAEANLVTVLTRMGEIARNLNKTSVIVNDLKDSIGLFLKQYSFKNDVRFRFEYDVTAEFDNNLALQLYLIIQELVNNTMRHTQARLVDICFRELECKIYIYYTDDGEGQLPFDHAGLGIKSITDRARQLGGWVKIEDSPGIKFFFIIPFKKTNSNGHGGK